MISWSAILGINYLWLLWSLFDRLHIEFGNYQSPSNWILLCIGIFPILDCFCYYWIFITKIKCILQILLWEQNLQQSMSSFMDIGYWKWIQWIPISFKLRTEINKYWNWRPFNFYFKIPVKSWKYQIHQTPLKWE